MQLETILKHILDVSIALSTETDTSRLLEHILRTAKGIAHADGGTIYSVNKNQELVFDTVLNDALGLYLGGAEGAPIEFSPIPIYTDGEINTTTVVSQCAGHLQVINIENIYTNDRYDFSGAKNMDIKTGYDTRSMLTIPMTNHDGDLNGVLQLINATDGDDIIPFSEQMEHTIKAMASLAATVLTNRHLIDSMENLFESFSRLIAKAIDEKSPYTGGHCRRVPELTMMIAEAVDRWDTGPHAEFKMTAQDKNELSLAGWMHDCGKIATPEVVMDKATKLHTIFDRIELVKTRIDIVKRDLEISYLKAAHAATTDQEIDEAQARFNQQLAQLEDDCRFLENANTGGEFMTESDQQRVADIATRYHVVIAHEQRDLLTDDEIKSLQVSRGTLTDDERQIINRHMDITCEMLEALPFPKHLARVPEFAGGHHEKMDGTGYPKGLTKEQMSVPARMMGIADIFEALTAADRPYKEAKPLSECLSIMSKMSHHHHIDHELFEIFVKERVYLTYAERFLARDQIDEIDEQIVLEQAIPRGNL